MNILELFAGIGACSKALEKLGVDFEIVDAVEIDKYAIASFNAIHNTNFVVQDITKWDKDLKEKDIDLITHRVALSGLLKCRKTSRRRFRKWNKVKSYV